MAFGTKIIGTGAAFPQGEMKNVEFESFLDTSDEWIRTRTGIEARHIANPVLGESTLSLAVDAARKALILANVRAEDLDLIVIGTVTPDSVMPCTANQLQNVLGAVRAFSFDLQAACAGFIYGLSIADHFMKSGTIRTALVIGAETLSTIVNWKDRTTCVLFGDGAGAVVVERTESEHRVMGTRLYTDGRLGDILKIPHGYSKVPPSHRDYRRELHTIQMQGKEVFKFAVKAMVDASSAILSDHGILASQIDHFIFHQANIRIIDMCAQLLHIDRNKVWVNLQKFGNTSAATMPVCLDEAWRSGAAKPGHLVLMATFGGGVSWGSALIRL